MCPSEYIARFKAHNQLPFSHPADLAALDLDISSDHMRHPGSVHFPMYYSLQRIDLGSDLNRVHVSDPSPTVGQNSLSSSAHGGCVLELERIIRRTSGWGDARVFNYSVIKVDESVPGTIEMRK